MVLTQDSNQLIFFTSANKIFNYLVSVPTFPTFLAQIPKFNSTFTFVRDNNNKPIV